MQIRGGDLSTFGSISGFVFNVGSGVISWSSKRHAIVALSTLEAEYRVQTLVSREALWLHMLVKNLIPDQPTPHATVIYCGNQGAITLAKEPNFYARTKYI
jgi:hypothetical protein